MTGSILLGVLSASAARTHAHVAVAMCLVLLAGAGVFGEERHLLVEAEAFDDVGGWVVDQQFMDQMGSPMLLAHGMGVPVKDATTMVSFPAAGRYRVWVRTRDWAATFAAPEIRSATPQSTTVIIPSSIVIIMDIYDEDNNVVIVHVNALDPEQNWHNTTAVFDGADYTGYINTFNQPTGEWAIYIDVIDLDGASDSIEEPLLVEVIVTTDPLGPLLLIGIGAAAIGISAIIIYTKRKGL